MRLRPVKSITIDGLKWRIQWSGKNMTKDGRLGECDDPTVKNRAIRIKPNLAPFLELDVLLHEMDHASDFKKGEDYVNQHATEKSKVLWRLGYRRLDQEELNAWEAKRGLNG